MERLLAFDHEDEFLFELVPEEVFELVMHEEINGEHYLLVTTTRRLEKEQRLIMQDATGKWREWVVTTEEVAHEGGRFVVGSYQCVWSLQHDLSTSPVSHIPSNKTAGEALALVLSNSRWGVGTVQLTNSASASMYRTTAWEALSTLVRVWGGEVDASISVNQNRVESRAVDLLLHVGSTSVTRRFDYGHDLTGVRRTVESDPFACRIVPLGKGEESGDGYGRKITIEDVNGGRDYLQNDDVVAYVRMPNGSGGWEYPTIYAENPDIDSPAALLAWGESVLKELTAPRVTYEADVMQLSQAGMDVYGIALGDVVRCVDRGFSEDGLRVEGRVASIDANLLDPSDTRVEIGYVSQSLVAGINDSLNSRIDDILNSGAFTLTDAYMTALLARLNEEANLTGGYAYYTEGQGIRTYDTAVSDPLVGAEASKVTELKGGVLRFADSRTSSGDWDFKTVIVSGHVASELVTAVQIVSGFIGSAASGNYWNLDTGEFRMAALDNLKLGATNLIRNGDFSNGVNYWTGTGTTRTVETDSTFGQCLKVVQPGAGGSSYRAFSQGFAHKMGTTYSISFWAKADANNTVTAVVASNTASANRYVDKAEITTSWQRYTGTITPINNNGALGFYLTSAGTLYLANVMLVESDKPMLTWGPDPRDALVPVDAYLTQTEVFNRLTNNGALQGLYMSGNQLYINASYIKTGQLLADLITSGKITSANGKVYFDLDNNELRCNVLTSTYSSSEVLYARLANGYIGGDGTYAGGGYNIKGLLLYNDSYAGMGLGLIPGNTSDMPQVFTVGYGMLVVCRTTQGGGTRTPGNAGMGISTNGYTQISGQNNVAGWTSSAIEGSSNTYLGRIVLHPRYVGSDTTYTTDGHVVVFGRLYAQYNTAEFSSINVSGTKNRVVETPDYDERLLSCYEMPTPMFGDIGSGTIGDDGLCYVSIDDVFAETVRTDMAYQVFLQKCGQGDLWVSEKHPGYFVVEGTPNLRFDWELKAKQRDFENLRMENRTLSETMADNTEDYAGSVENGYGDELEEYISSIEQAYNELEVTNEAA